MYLDQHSSFQEKNAIFHMGENEKDNNKSKPHPVDNSILVLRHGVNI